MDRCSNTVVSWPLILKWWWRESCRDVFSHQSRAACLFVAPVFILHFSLSLNLFAKIPNGPIHVNATFLMFICTVHIEICSSAISHNTPQYIPIACPRAFCPKGSWETDTPWGCCFHSLREKHSREAEREQQSGSGSSSMSLFAWCHYNGNMHKWEKA